MSIYHKISLFTYFMKSVERGERPFSQKIQQTQNCLAASSVVVKPATCLRGDLQLCCLHFATKMYKWGKDWDLFIFGCTGQ